MKKHFGVDFRETDTGFVVEFSGDEETIKARKEAVEAFKDFLGKAKKAMHHPHPHRHGHHHGHFHGRGCCGHKEGQDVQQEVKSEKVQE
ncbi:MAG TPA: hypothetical protein VNU93_06875 [Verrucomicrobiae bacterium]|nr:hypothetical protein [Verrucomicrobiae bacterium]